MYTLFLPNKLHLGADLKVSESRGCATRLHAGNLVIIEMEERHPVGKPGAAWHTIAHGDIVMYSLLSSLCALALQFSANDVQFVKEWGGLGEAPGRFNFPIGIAIDAHDVIFVADHYNGRVQKFDVEGQFLGAFKTLAGPGGIAVSPKGNVYTTHFAAGSNEKGPVTQCISEYGTDGKLIRQWGKQGSGDGDMDCPGGLAFGKDNCLYLADQTNHRVQVFDEDGKFLRKWGEYGNATGQFGGKENKLARTGGPQFVALDAAGHVFTTEGLNCRVQQFDAQGKFLRAWECAEDKPGCLGGFFKWNDRPSRLQGPIGICVGHDGNLWVTACSGRVQQFTPAGKFLRGMTDGQGTKPGQFTVPHGVAVDSKGNLYVTDSFNHRIQKFSVAAK